MANVNNRCNEEIRISEKWIVYMYNVLDAEFGYDPGAEVFMYGLEPSVAKSIARHMNGKSPDFIHYYAEPEPIRYW